jgi:putative cell wall-binding protein
MYKKALALIAIFALLLTLMTGMVTMSASAAGTYQRLAGADRYETSAAISRKGWEGTDAVVITCGENFPDGLAGGPLAYKLNAPLLLVQKNQIPVPILKEIQRLKPQKAYILGGPGVVSDSVKQTLEDKGISVERVYGVDRAATAAKIAKIIGAPDGKAVIASGLNFPDALAAAPVAAKNGWPILFVSGSTIPTATKDALTALNINQVDIIGGIGVVPSDIEVKLIEMGMDTKRLSGYNRELTSLDIAKTYFEPGDGIILATGRSYADALSVSPFAAKIGQPVILCSTDSVASKIRTTAKETGLTTDEVTVVGGIGAVSQKAVNKLFSPPDSKIVNYDQDLTEAVQNGMTPVFTDQASKIKAYYNAAQNILSSIIVPGMSDYEKEKAIHDYIIDNTKYDMENYLNDTIPPDSYSPYGALINHVAVCEGFAEATDLLLNMAGIESMVVFGEANNGEITGGHGWNIVKIDGKYYHVDTTWEYPAEITQDDTTDITWDDSEWFEAENPTPSSVGILDPIYLRYKYFNLSDSQIGKNHFWDKENYPACPKPGPHPQYDNRRYPTSY